MSSVYGYDYIHVHSDDSTVYDSETLTNNCLDILANEVIKSKVSNPIIQLVHSDCYLSNALTQIIARNYRVQHSLISVLLDGLGKNDCKECTNALIETCLIYIGKFDKFSDKLNLPLQILSIIATDDKLTGIRNILSRYTDDDYACLYWKVALFNQSVPKDHLTAMSNSLLLNHYNFKSKTKYQDAFDKLTLEANSSLWIKTFNSIHKRYKYGRFTDVSIKKYIEIINNYRETPWYNYVVNGLYTTIVYSIMEYLANNVCVNYFNVRCLINGLIALLVKFGDTILKYRLNLIIGIFKKLICATNCNCQYTRIGYCISGVLIKSDIVKLAKVLEIIAHRNYFLHRMIKNFEFWVNNLENVANTTLQTIKFTDYSTIISQDIDEFKELTIERAILILDWTTKYVESLYVIKNCLLKSINYNRKHNNPKLNEMIQILAEKYDNLNDRADIHLTLSCDSLFDENGQLKAWVRSAESCDCPGE
ncbi:hypothetical protein BMR1_03g04405 [Babesia microti strain RI]|uniref:Uncharacterized protein n=1 Tax=Babesia microti (strain RI) TaxID=1133968 RepID=A0A0K3ASP6_BABMR|nr:hypothetical protein BMR1_03g04405 [Babesia microti strain RI]CTQ41480.1 hypothetical protein BMR1_03g04405 [Babesia microti strain RI]|eukprot:XP_012649491.1 hypothetical protein BMR1_03g04405 [Babesia microti strain RI]